MRNHELTIETKTGEKRQILFSGSVVQSKAGRPIGIVCVIRDISDRKKMEERLVKAERLASIGELSGQLAHDLRNPLAGIKNGVYLIRKKGNRITDEERNEILKILDVAIEDSDRIITSLVEYSSELHLQPEQCTPKSLIQKALQKIQVPQNITIKNNVNDDTKMFLDAQKIETVFANILENAIQATPEKGIIQIQNATNGSNIEIAVADTGAGIPDNVLPKLFSPLVTTKAKGMGMGLAICKRVVEAHGGKISVTSTVGQGSTFRVILPVKQSKTEFGHVQAFIGLESNLKATV